MINTTEKIEKDIIDSLITKYETLIFDQTMWMDQDMWKIAEVTYSYVRNFNEGEQNSPIVTNYTIDNKNININYTLFVKIGELNLSQFQSLSDAKKK